MSCVSDISTQNLIEDGLNLSDYKEDYTETRTDQKYCCSKCNSSFANKQTLSIHQSTSSLKCSKISGDDSSSSNSSKICQYCEKSFASKQMRLYHETKCVNKIISLLKQQHKNDMDILYDEIKSLKLEIKKRNDVDENI